MVFEESGLNKFVSLSSLNFAKVLFLPDEVDSPIMIQGGVLLRSREALCGAKVVPLGRTVL